MEALATLASLTLLAALVVALLKRWL